VRCWPRWLRRSRSWSRVVVPRRPGHICPSLHSIKTIASTVPPNGDVNPYGIAIVARTVGTLTAGDFLVSNFNAKSNNQGTGSTIVQISPAGKLSVFAHLTAHSLPGACPGGVGLTGALGVLPHGYVVVGSLPTTNGQSATAKYGCLIVLTGPGIPSKRSQGRTSRDRGAWRPSRKARRRRSSSAMRSTVALTTVPTPCPPQRSCGSGSRPPAAPRALRASGSSPTRSLGVTTRPLW